MVQRESKIQTDFRPLGVHPGGIHEAVADDLVVGPFRPSVRFKPSLRTRARKASVSGPKSNHFAMTAPWRKQAMRVALHLRRPDFTRCDQLQWQG